MRRQGESLTMQNYCAEIKIRAERKAGEMLANMEKHPGAATRSHDVTAPRLADVGISKMQSSRWQSIASIPEDVFEREIAETKANEGELTSAALRTSLGDRYPTHCGFIIIEVSAISAWADRSSIELNRIIGTERRTAFCAPGLLAKSVDSSHCHGPRTYEVDFSVRDRSKCEAK